MTEIDNETLKKIYRKIKSTAVGIHNDPDYNNFPDTKKKNWEDFLQNGKLSVNLTEELFPVDFSVKFEDLHYFLKELNDLDLIKYDNNGWGPIYVKVPGMEHRQPKNGYVVRFLKIVDPNTYVFKDNKKNINTLVTKTTSDYFKTQTCILEYDGKTYSPHKKGGRCKILKELWGSRKVEGKAKKAGMPTSISVLVAIGGFNNDGGVRDAIRDIRAGIKKIKANDFIKIVPQNGSYILIVKEQKAS